MKLETKIRTMIVIGLVAFSVALGSIVGYACGDNLGHTYCHAWEATSTQLWYVERDPDSYVILIAHCPDVSTNWALGPIHGHEPSLSEWSRMQNDASQLLIRDGP